jgi:AraC family transcriptional regulator
MMGDAVVEKVEPELQTVAIRLATSPETIGADLGRAYGDLFTYLSERGQTLQDAPICYYRTWEPDNWVIEACLVVNGEMEELGEIHPLVIPGGPAAVSIHVGPYEELRKTHAALAAWCDEHGREMTGSYERYLTDPAEAPDPADYQTEVIWLLRPV